MDTLLYQLPGHGLLAEPLLAFHPQRTQDCDVHPLRGLVASGPYSRALVNHVLDPIRVAAIAPYGEMKVVDTVLAELDQRHLPRERRQYLIEYPGFSRVFGLRVSWASDNTHIELPRSMEEEIAKSPVPHTVLAERITRAISSLQCHRSDFDVLVIYLPNRWGQCFYGGRGEDFDLHDYLKAITAVQGVPTQILLEDSALTYPCRCSVMWRLSLALYCKAGGVPWKLANASPDTAYIGLSYAVRPTAENRLRFVTCCSQVFDSDGAGLEFVAYETDDVHIERDNPFLSRSEMRRVMARSLHLYQRRHAGRVPKHVVVHKTTEFKTDEVEGCFDAWRSSEGLDLIQIQQGVLWRGVQIDPPRDKNSPKGSPGSYPCLRGSYLQLSGRDVLLWTQGNAPAVTGGINFYKEGKGIPSPLLLTRYAGHGAWDEGCLSVLGLSKMNWNNDALYDRLPVTLSYAQILARTVKRMPQITPRPYEFRFFM